MQGIGLRMNEEVEFKKEIGEGVDYFRILKYRIAVICLIIGVIIEIIFQNIYGITNLGVISALYMTLCGIWDLKDLKDKE